MPKTSAAAATPPTVATTMLRGASLDPCVVAVSGAVGAAAFVVATALGPLTVSGAGLAVVVGLGAPLSDVGDKKLAETTSPAAGWTTTAAGPCASRASTTCWPGATSSTSASGAVPITGPPSIVTGAPAG